MSMTHFHWNTGKYSTEYFSHHSFSSDKMEVCSLFLSLCLYGHIWGNWINLISFTERLNSFLCKLRIFNLKNLQFARFSFQMRILTNSIESTVVWALFEPKLFNFRANHATHLWSCWSRASRLFITNIKIELKLCRLCDKQSVLLDDIGGWYCTESMRRGYELRAEQSNAEASHTALHLSILCTVHTPSTAHTQWCASLFCRYLCNVLDTIPLSIIKCTAIRLSIAVALQLLLQMTFT